MYDETGFGSKADSCGGNGFAPVAVFDIFHSGQALLSKQGSEHFCVAMRTYAPVIMGGLVCEIITMSEPAYSKPQPLSPEGTS